MAEQQKTDADQSLQTNTTQLKRYALLLELEQETEQMRIFQKQFFKERKSDILQKSKDYERRVDKLLEKLRQVDKQNQNQQNLFS